MITEIETYFTSGCGRCARFDTADCSSRKWAVGQAELRKICLEADLTETVKWGHPCYMFAGRNIVVMAALREDFRLNFFNPALMKDLEGVMEKQGPNTQHKDSLRFTNNAQVATMREIILTYIEEAKSYAAAGIKPTMVAREIELPDEMVEALDSDPELAEAFHALTPGRQRSYSFNLNSIKNSATRVARIEKFRPKILAGKGALDR
jgi:uncharacterized protein YdeI (YjbR/CyaY-like superfamily)